MDEADSAPNTVEAPLVTPALPMDAADMIRKFKEFFETHYHAELLEALRKGNKFITIDFQKLARFDPQLGDITLDVPHEALKAGELAVREFDQKVKGFMVRLANLPPSSFLMLRHVRSEHLGKMMFTEGLVRQKSDVRPQVTEAIFECPSCGNRLTVLQVEATFKEPSRCSCGRKGKFRLIGKELVDAQGIVLEEAPEQLEGGEQPKRMNLFLKNDLVSPMTEKRTNPGSKIRISGTIKEVPVTTKSGGTSTRFDLLIETNNVEPVEEDYTEIGISKEEMEAIFKIKDDPQLDRKLVDSVAPNIYGHERIKEALILQLMGGVRKTRDGGTGAVTRGDIHILLIGDPGSGKSQMLKRISKIAARGRFISGKGVSGAGLTASVVKDEFLGGWSLEAGALVLANKGICCIDELDKMTEEDRAAMHEALEGQSYHPDTELVLADGRRVTIGSLVDESMQTHPIVDGVECEFCFPKGVSLHTTNFKSVHTAPIVRVSRHPAPSSMMRITFSNGRSIVVTPNHPLFTYTEEGMGVVPACLARPGMAVPAPKVLPIKASTVSLVHPNVSYRLTRPHILPKVLTPALARLIGYVVSEGHTYSNPKTRVYEIGVSNTQECIIQDVCRLFDDVFAVKTIVSRRSSDHAKATRVLSTVRCASRPIVDFMALNFPEVMVKAPKKRVPALMLRADDVCVKEFLRSAFRGDGYVGRDDIGYCTASRKLAEDYQDLLLRLGFPSIIRSEERDDASYFKTVVTGSLREKQEAFGVVVEKDDPRRSRCAALLDRAARKCNQREPVPSFVASLVRRAQKELRMDDGDISSTLNRKHVPSRETIRRHVDSIGVRLGDVLRATSVRDVRRLTNVQVESVASGLGVSCSSCYGYEAAVDGKYQLYLSVVDEQVASKCDSVMTLLRPAVEFLRSDCRVMTITDVEIVPTDCALVYDVTIEPHHSFVAQGAVLHNTVTISKANVQATLRCETTVLAAANPKLGRFDPYEIIAKQIDLPPTLINRFDLIFPIKDLPDPVKDDTMASFILSLHREKDAHEAPIGTTLLRKYIAYCKRFCKPKLSDDAVQELKDYYIRMRSSGSKEGGIVKSIPISARQLEGLVRLAEAHARLRMGEWVERKDARRAIDLLDYCLRQIALDEETGQIDIDRISSDTSSSQRNKILVVKEIIKELENKLGKVIPLVDIEKDSKDKGIDDRDLEEILQKLRKSGDIFEPKRGFVSRI